VAPPLAEARLLKVAHYFQKVTDWHERMPAGYA
jgi:Asp-tRNA(Asn)/Glu-tRNA(Gln) amidotransferase A subunit family amidase